METDKNKDEKKEKHLLVNYMGVCDYPVCDFYTDCKDLDKINELCDKHMQSHPGHNATAIPC